MPKLNVSINIEVVESFEDDSSTVARVFYPEEGNTIKIKKGLNAIEFSEAIHHEIGHLFDWYLSDGKQSSCVENRENNAIEIGEALRWKRESPELL